MPYSQPSPRDQEASANLTRALRELKMPWPARTWMGRGGMVQTSAAQAYAALSPQAKAKVQAKIGEYTRKAAADRAAADRKARAKAAAERAKEAAKAEAEPYTIPGQDDTRVAFQKVQGRMPNAAELRSLRGHVRLARAAMDSSSEKDFIRAILELQFYIGRLAEPRGSDLKAIDDQVRSIMAESARMKTFVIGDGWNTGTFDTYGYFNKYQRRKPTPDEERTILHHVRTANKALAQGDEPNYQLPRQWIRFFGHNARNPSRVEYRRIVDSANQIVQAHIADYYAHKPHGFLGHIEEAFSDLGHALTSATDSFLKLPGVSILADATGSIIHGAEKLYHDATDLVDKIPFVGSALHAGMNLMGGEALELSDKIASGENISQLAMTGLKETLADANTVSSYVTAVTSFVPVAGQIGAGIKGALAAANALSQGRNITDALVQAAEDTALSAIPGGSVGDIVKKGAVEAIAAAKALIAGESLDQVALERLRANLPGGDEIKKAFDVSVALAQGRKLQGIIIDGVKTMGADALGKLASQGSELVQHSQVLQDAAKTARNIGEKAEEGFHLATGALARTGVPPEALSILRQKLDPEGKVGFDKAVLAHASATALGKKTQELIVHKINTLPALGLQKFAAKGEEHVNQSKDLRSRAQALPDKKHQDGFKLATGVLAHTQVPPRAILAFAKKLNPPALHGFDKGIAANRLARKDRIAIMDHRVKAAVDASVG